MQRYSRCKINLKLLLHDPAPPDLYTLSLHDALPIFLSKPGPLTPEEFQKIRAHPKVGADIVSSVPRSEEHTSELQSPMYLVSRLLLEKKNYFITCLDGTSAVFFCGLDSCSVEVALC